MSRSGHVGFVVDEVTMGQVFLHVFWFLPLNVFPWWLSILVCHLGEEKSVCWWPQFRDMISPHWHEERQFHAVHQFSDHEGALQSLSQSNTAPTALICPFTRNQTLSVKTVSFVSRTSSRTAHKSSYKNLFFSHYCLLQLLETVTLYGHRCKFLVTLHALVFDNCARHLKR
jgi:hypothetical protein